MTERLQTDATFPIESHEEADPEPESESVPSPAVKLLAAPPLSEVNSTEEPPRSSRTFISDQETDQAVQSIFDEEEADEFPQYPDFVMTSDEKEVTEKELPAPVEKTKSLTSSSSDSTSSEDISPKPSTSSVEPMIGIQEEIEKDEDSMAPKDTLSETLEKEKERRKAEKEMMKKKKHRKEDDSDESGSTSNEELDLEVKKSTKELTQEEKDHRLALILSKGSIYDNLNSRRTSDRKGHDSLNKWRQKNQNASGATLQRRVLIESSEDDEGDDDDDKKSESSSGEASETEQQRFLAPPSIPTTSAPTSETVKEQKHKNHKEREKGELSSSSEDEENHDDEFQRHQRQQEERENRKRQKSLTSYSSDEQAERIKRSRREDNEDVMRQNMQRTKEEQKQRKRKLALVYEDISDEEEIEEASRFRRQSTSSVTSNHGRREKSGKTPLRVVTPAVTPLQSPKILSPKIISPKILSPKTSISSIKRSSISDTDPLISPRPRNRTTSSTSTATTSSKPAKKSVSDDEKTVEPIVISDEVAAKSGVSQEESPQMSFDLLLDSFVTRMKNIQNETEAKKQQLVRVAMNLMLKAYPHALETMKRFVDSLSSPEERDGIRGVRNLRIIDKAYEANPHLNREDILILAEKTGKEPKRIQEIVTRRRKAEALKLEKETVEKKKEVDNGETEEATFQRWFYNNFPMVWTGRLALKSTETMVNLHMINGSETFLNGVLGRHLTNDNPRRDSVKILQRLRLDNGQVEHIYGILTNPEYACCLALSSVTEYENLARNESNLKASFIDYLTKKQIAGISSLEEVDAKFKSARVHVFAPGEIVNKYLSELASSLHDYLQNTDTRYLLIVFTNDKVDPNMDGPPPITSLAVPPPPISSS